MYTNEHFAIRVLREKLKKAGHTILLLDSALAYHREVTRQASGMPEAVEHLLPPRLRDPDFTRVLIVTVPEGTPVHEAAKLQNDLKRAGIAPFAWVVNQCLTPLVVSDPVLVSRRAHEARYVREVVTEHTHRAALISWQVEPPIGRGPLLALTAPPALKELVPA